MKISSIYVGNSLRNYNHYFVSNNKLSAYIFDPLKLDKILAGLPSSIEKLYLLNTHDHSDHISKNEEMLKLSNSTHIKMKNNEEIKISDSESIQAIYTPGHHKDHICYLVKEANKNSYLISGDTIFNCGVGHCKMKGANVNQLFDSIELLLGLDEETIILPSHDYFLTNLRFAKTIECDNKDIDYYISRVERDGVFFTTIKEESLINPFFRYKIIKDLSDFKGMTSREVFTKIRSLRDKW